MEGSANYDDFAYHTSLLIPFDIEEETKTSADDDKAVSKNVSRKSHTVLTETTEASFKIGQTVHGKVPHQAPPVKGRRMGNKRSSSFL